MQVNVPIVDGALWQPGMTVAPTMQTMPMTTVAAEQFYVPEHVPMGSAEAPVEMQYAVQETPVQEVYYYHPEVMEPGNSFLPMATAA